MAQPVVIGDWDQARSVGYSVRQTWFITSTFVCDFIVPLEWGHRRCSRLSLGHNHVQVLETNAASPKEDVPPSYPQVILSKVWALVIILNPNFLWWTGELTTSQGYGSIVFRLYLCISLKQTNDTDVCSISLSFLCVVLFLEYLLCNVSVGLLFPL